MTLQLFLVAVLPLILLVLIVTFGSLSMHHQAMRSLVANRNLRAVQYAAAGIEKEIEHRIDILELLATVLDSIDTLAGAFDDVQSDVNVFEGGTAVLAPDGTIAASTGSQKAIEWLNSQPGKSLFDQYRKFPAGSAVFLPVTTISGEYFVPIWVNSANKASLVGLISPQVMLQNSLSAITNAGSMTVLVVDDRYEVLFREGTLDLDENLATHPGLDDALAGIGGIDYFPTNSGEHVITTSAVQPVGWALMIEESWEDIASPLLRATQNAPLIAIPIMALSLLAIWFGLRRIVQPMQALEAKTADLAQGNFETIRQPVGGVMEIRHLQETLIHMAAELKEAQNSLHSYIGAITASVESERRNLSRELHDETLQTLIALGQFTQYALHWNKDEKVAKTLNQVVSLTDQGTKNLRRLVQGLRPIYIEDLGLATALAMQENDNEPGQGVQIHYLQEGFERRLNPEVEMAMYRMAQAALSNVYQHAQARNAWITLIFQPEIVVLEIRDDGLGFNPPADPIHFARMGHYGLLGLYERSELIGAKLSIRSGPGEGTRVIIRLAGDSAKGVD
ncbi:MAG TPA: histidine kinase [Bellilinea sp.]|nr:histidine kinase [Bellilinea sp.]